jgi:NAD(P)-dependent dehydrogenase (short-subunit alcohol dehydrogenase family)
METLTRAWAAEFGPPGVRVNAISPGVVRSPIKNDPAAAMMNGTPYGAFGTPEAIALCLAEPEKSEIKEIKDEVLRSLRSVR